MRLRILAVALCFAAVFGQLAYAQSLLPDHVILDDLVVIGGTCVGGDCAPNNVFAEDALVLKENNNRFSFGLPDQEGTFRMVANQARNGGENQFSFDMVRVTSVPATLDAQQIFAAQGSLVPSPAVTVMQDGRLKVVISGVGVTFYQGGDIPASASDLDVSLPGGATEYYLPAGSYTVAPNPNGLNIPGDYESMIYTVLDPTQAETFAGEPVIAVATYSAPLVGFSNDGNSVTLGEGSETVDGAVSVGSASSTRKITNLAFGTQSSDLLAYGQLPDLDTVVRGTQLGQLMQAIDSTFQKIGGMSAMNVALSALQPNPRGPSNGNISLGLGAYDGEVAYAMGTHFYFGDGQTIKLGAASNGRFDDFQVSIGFGYSW